MKQSKPKGASRTSPPTSSRRRGTEPKGADSLSARNQNHNRASDKIRFLAVTGVVAGLYTAMTLLLAPLSFGVVQCRVSETLTILAAYHPAGVAGLTLGCAISNLVGLTMGANTAGALDILLGTLATGAAALVSYWLRHIRWGGLPILSTIPPVVFNALIIGTELTLVLGPVNSTTWLMWMGSVAVGQLIACVGGGLPLARMLEKSGLAARFTTNSFTNR